MGDWGELSCISGDFISYNRYNPILITGDGAHLVEEPGYNAPLRDWLPVYEGIRFMWGFADAWGMLQGYVLRINLLCILIYVSLYTSRNLRGFIFWDPKNIPIKKRSPQEVFVFWVYVPGVCESTLENSLPNDWESRRKNLLLDNEDGAFVPATNSQHSDGRKSCGTLVTRWTAARWFPIPWVLSWWWFSLLFFCFFFGDAGMGNGKKTTVSSEIWSHEQVSEG